MAGLFFSWQLAMYMGIFENLAIGKKLQYKTALDTHEQLIIYLYVHIHTYIHR